MAEEKRHRENEKGEDKKKKKKIPHVRLSSKIDEFSISDEKIEYNGDGYGSEEISLTKSEDRYRKYMRESEDERNEKLAIEKGWCTNDGIPWSRNQMPKDEAALLKQGIVDRSGTRSTYFSLNSNKMDKFSTGYPKFYDEIELLKEGLVDKNGHQKASGAEKENVKHSKGPISIAELNSRGFLDKNGNIYYGKIPSSSSDHSAIKHSKKSKEQKEKMKQDSAATTKSPRVQLCDSHESETIVKTPFSSASDFEAHSETRVSFSPSRNYTFSDSPSIKIPKKCRKSKKTISSSPSQNSSSSSVAAASDGTFGMIQCDAGQGEDSGTIKYAISNDGRNYELNTKDGHYLQLEFNKRHAYLIID
uniref:Uncharacterized protein n=1 Tax=Panagrolaimus sp. ES5 TaxID=591445 RepID=A0AC34FY18_9BILA